MKPINYFITLLDDEGDRTVAFPQCWHDLAVAKDWKDEVEGDSPGRGARVECLEFPLGATVIFGDTTATVPLQEMGDKVVLAEGRVINLPTQVGGRIFVDVEAECESYGDVRGEARIFRKKKVVVYAGTVVGVEPPAIKPFEEGMFGGEPLY